MSRIWLFLLAILAVGPLAAQNKSQLEYHLPGEGKDWEVSRELSNKNKVVYIPKNSPLTGLTESFSINVNYFPLNLNDQTSLGDDIKALYPNYKIDFKFLEKTPHSLLCEFSANEAGQEKVHGWIRGLSNSHATFFLSYYTTMTDNINNVAAAWLKTLTEAKINEEPQ